MRQQDRLTFQEMLQLADLLMQTQGILPPHIQTKGECVAIMLAGQELGFQAMASLRLVVLIKGKVTVDAAGQLALMIARGAKVQWLKDGRDGTAHLRIGRPGNPVHDEVFSLEMAKKAGLLSNAMWNKYPDKMLRARVVSAVGKAYFPDVLAGVYAPGEMDDDARDERPHEIGSESGFVTHVLPAGRAIPGGGFEVERTDVPARQLGAGNTIPASPPPPPATGARNVADVLRDIATCDDVSKLEPLLNEARALYKSLPPALQQEVVSVGKRAPEQVAERQRLRLEAEEAERALSARADAALAEPGANDEPDPADMAPLPDHHDADLTAERRDEMEGVF